MLHYMIVYCILAEMYEVRFVSKIQLVLLSAQPFAKQFGKCIVSKINAPSAVLICESTGGLGHTKPRPQWT